MPLNLMTSEPFVTDAARFKALISATSDIIYRVSPDWSHILVTYEQGQSSASHQANNEWMKVYVHPDDRDTVSLAIAAALESKGTLILEHRMPDGGKPRWAISRAVPIMDIDGKITEWFGTISDISGYKNAEQDLKEEKERSEQQIRLYETIASSTPDLIYVFDLEYRFTYANKALLSMWGKTWDEAIGKGLLQNGYEAWHAEMHEREIDQVRATKLPIRGEVSFPHAILGRRIYDYIFTPVFNEAGEVEAVAGTTRDITEIRNAEKTISESEHRFRMMAEGTDIFISLMDEANNTTYFNRTWTIVTGRPMAELLRVGWIDMIHPQDRSGVKAAIEDAFGNFQPFDCEFRICDSSGDYIWLLAKGSPRFHTDGSFAGYVSSGIDITERKLNEIRKGDFISMVSHELKTPLTSLTLILQMLELNLDGKVEAGTTELLDRSGILLKKMNTLIGSFLNVSRLESSNLLINKSHFDLCELINDTINETRLISTYEFIFNYKDPVPVEADKDKIASVISNLLINAVKYSPYSRKIEIACINEEKGAIVSVRDNGIGINEQDKEKVFDRYFRVSDQQTKFVSGFGIGLYLSSEIVKMHGGSIWVESEQGRGSTFYFSLPFKK